jgi:hypothetical protein
MWLSPVNAMHFSKKSCQGGVHRRRPDPKMSDAAQTIEDFRFLPLELSAKCLAVVQKYHAVHGYSCLPDILWRSAIRELIENHNVLRQKFIRACKKKSAKQAYESMQGIAATMLALEILVHDFAGWGRDFPDARQQAEKLLGVAPFRYRTWLLDSYIYDSFDALQTASRTLARAL